MSISGRFERLATRVTYAAGSSWAFALAAASIVLWLACGPLFGFSDTWQLVVNTATTIITFLMVFLIQRSQNKDALSIQTKLNEIIAALEGASNRLINIEDLSEAEVADLHRHYEKIAALAANDLAPTRSHSVEETRGLCSPTGDKPNPRSD